MNRVLSGVALFCELAALAMFGVALAYGRFDQGIFFFLYIFGLIVAFSAAVAWSMPHGITAKVVTHGALLVGCAIFALPFAWMVGTGFKYNEEIFTYPPKWIPSFPKHIMRSPYVTAELHEAIERPSQLTRTRWTALWPRLEEAIWQKGRSLLNKESLVGLNEADLQRALVRGLWSTISKALDRNLWDKPDTDILRGVEARIDEERVGEVWGSIYRSVALGEVTVKDIRLTDHRIKPEGVSPQTWKPAEGVEVRCVRRAVEQGGRSVPPLVVEYDLQRSARVAVSAVVPMPMPSAELLSVTVPMRQDRSWHCLKFTLEVDGKRYVPEDSLRLQQYRWQELTFKIKSLDPRDERNVGVWPLVLSDSPSDFREPGRMRLTLGIERTSRVSAILNKYFFSYRSAYIATNHLWGYVFNTAYLVVLNVIGQVLSCSLIAYAFARLKWPGRDVLFGLLLATMMLPPQVTMIPVFIIFKSLNWYNTLKALWVPSLFGSAFFIFLLRQFMKTIPTELEDAAKVDGCGFFGVYWRVILPLLKPALAAVAIFTFVGAWNNFMGPLIYLNDQRLYPLALGLFEFRTQYRSEYGMLMAASTMMTLPIIAVFFLAQRYFIQGVTLTGLKG